MAPVDPGLAARLDAVLARRRSALVARDVAGLRAVLHPDFTYTNASGSVLDVAGYLDLTVRGELHWRDQLVEQRRVLVDGTTVVLGAVVVDRVEVGGKEHQWRFATTQVYVEHAGELLYLAGHTGPLGA